jgi:hypothetical protein
LSPVETAVKRCAIEAQPPVHKFIRRAREQFDKLPLVSLLNRDTLTDVIIQSPRRRR